MTVPNRETAHSITPEKNSIRATLLEHSRTRLYVHPLQWTADHLKHLGCELHVLNFDPRDESKIETADGISWQNALTYTETLGVWGARKQWDTHMNILVGRLSRMAGLEVDGKYLSLRYNGRAVADIGLPILFYDKDKPGCRIWAYTDATWISKCRWNFYKRRKRSWSYTILKLRRSKNLPIDPLYIAILITLAQNASRHGAGALQEVSLFVPNHTTPVREASEKQSKWRYVRPRTTLVQYTAVISQEYLQKLEDPYHYHDATLEVYQKSLPIDHLGAIYYAIKDASGLYSDNTDLKRKAFVDLTSMDHNGARTAKHARHDMGDKVLSPVGDEKDKG